VVATVVRGADKADWTSMLLAEGLARPLHRLRAETGLVPLT
jgi:hypothetical protein